MKNKRGFTLIEVLIALLILTGGIIVLAQAWSGNFMRIRKSAMFNDAATLLERKMVETESKYKGKPLNEVLDDDGGDFGSDYPNYTWKMKSRDLKIPDLTPLLVGTENADESIIGMVKQFTETLGKSIKEIKVSIFVKRNNRELEFSAVQYIVDFGGDALGGLAGAAGGGDTSTTTTQPASGGKK